MSFYQTHRYIAKLLKPGPSHDQLRALDRIDELYLT